ncbi:MAG: heme o synthase [Phycisphaeraceae bacterium]
MTQLSRHDNVLALDAATVSATWRSRLADYVQLSKVRITVMVVATTWLGFMLGEKAATQGWLGIGPAVGGWGALVGAMIGTALSCMGASVLNQVYERDTDALMNRTKDRPIPAGRISMRAALFFGLTLSTAGVVTLAVAASDIAAFLAAFTILSYALIYTPMKRVSSTSTIIGAVPGALPPVIGYAAATDALGMGAVVMFTIMFLWQLPHFLAIAWLYRADYERGGFPMLPVIDPTGGSTFRQMVLCCAALLPVGLMPTMLGMAGAAYFYVALAAGTAFLGFALGLVLRPTAGRARAMFFASLVYLPLVLAMMVIDRT